MIKGLQAGFGTLLGLKTLEDLKSRGVQMVRLDCMGLGPYATNLLARDASNAGLQPLVIVSSSLQLGQLPPGTNIELLNEPDLNGPSPATYEAKVWEFAGEAQRLGLHLWAGAVSNLNGRGFAFLEKAHVQNWPKSVNVSVHRYPNGENPTVPHGGFSSRTAEVEWLKEIIGPRRWGVSEFGYTTGNRANWWQKLFGIKRQWTDLQVHAFTVWEFDFWKRTGAAGAVLYQLNDGPTTEPINRMGIRRTDGSWKPVAEAFA